jgi:hypothetical protein
MATTPECSIRCERLLPAVPMEPPSSSLGTAAAAVVVSSGGLLAAAGYIFRKTIATLLKPIRHGVPSIDDIPLDEIEMPWRQW